MLYMQQQHQRQRGPVGALDHSPPVQTSPTHSPHSNHIIGPPRVPPTHRGPVPKVCVTSHENDTDEVKKKKNFFSLKPITHRLGGNRKRYQQSTNADQKSIETVFSIPICRQCGAKWQSKTLFLLIFIYVPR